MSNNTDGNTTQKRRQSIKSAKQKEISKIPENKKGGTIGNDITITKTITADDIWKTHGPPPDNCVIVTPDGARWISRNSKWYKMNSNYLLGQLYADDSMILVDPVNIIPGEKCTCGRPKTEFEKIGINTYGDYLKKCTIKGSLSNPFGKVINYSDARKGLAIVLKGLSKPTDNYYSVQAKKTSPTTIESFIVTGST